MKYYEAEAEIAAEPETVWSVLTDAAGFSRWDSGVERIDGAITPGGTITVRSKAAPARAFPVKVTAFDRPGRMVWSGGMPLGLFKGVRTFTLTQRGQRTHFHVREEYTGPLLGMMWRSMPDLGPSFRQLAQGLRAEAERRRPG